MHDESYSRVEGRALGELVDEIRAEFLARPMYVDLRHELRQLNCLRVVAVEVFERSPVERQLAVVGDLLRHNAELHLHRAASEIFCASDSPAAYVVDLVCEIVWQALMQDPAIHVEDELRHALAAV